MAQARWIGVDGIDERTLGPYWGIGLRHDLADAARDYDWPRVLHILSAHRDWINASRPGGRARYAPVHQAAHGGAPAPVIHRLIGMGAWRTLRNRRGERPVDIARRRGHVRLVPILKPVCPRHDVPLDALNRVQGHFHALIREYPAGRKRCLRLPELEPLLEMGRESVYFEVLGMFGGFVYSLEEDGTVPRLMVERFSRVLTCHRFRNHARRLHAGRQFGWSAWPIADSPRPRCRRWPITRAKNRYAGTSTMHPRRRESTRRRRAGRQTQVICRSPRFGLPTVTPASWSCHRRVCAGSRAARARLCGSRTRTSYNGTDMPAASSA